jgi:hypothetical protein
MNANRVLLMQLSERTSAKGNAYLSGWLDKASVVAFRGEDDKHGNPTWDVFVSEPQPRPEAGQERPQAGPERRPQSPDPGDAAKPSARQQRPESVTARSPARHQGQGDGWRGSQYRRPANGTRRAPAADDGAFIEDSLEDIGRAGR